ncbi:MAG: hypothetical protein LYZ70_02530 [Nitrososphaerales archaeon]|nr:hypothetical protein [Nitrososphaerales archaeon]
MKERPIVISSDGGEKAFCSAECAMSEDGGRGDLLSGLVRLRDNLITRMEEGRRSKVIALIHRYEVKEGGDQYITIDNTEDILQEIHAVPAKMRIDFIIHCPGGMVLPAEQIALALRSHKGGVTAIVPYYAMSGATLICLAADEIVLEPFGVLGPLDPQIGGFPSPSLLRLLGLKPAQFIGDQTLILADIAEKALSQMREFVTSLLSSKMDLQHAKKVAEYLTGGYLTHDAAITAKELNSLGLRISVGVPPEVYDFMRLHKLAQWSPLGDSGLISYAPSSRHAKAL